MINIQQGFVSAGVTRAIEAANPVFDFNSFDKFKKNSTSTQMLITNDKDKINAFYNQSWMMVVVQNNYIRMLKDHLEYCTRLIAYLKKTYDID
jgi:hypothetical protein